MEVIASEIRRFLSTTEPEVMCISGHWGVGKTFAWNRYLREAQKAKSIALNRYSYVSLFGVNSLDEFKYSVFEDSVNSSDIGVEPSLETLHTNTMAAAQRFGRKSLWFLQQVPLVKNYVGGLGPVWFLSVRNAIICIDDIERRGSGLTVRDIMGLASNLKEHRGCKIVLILNDEALEGDKKDFNTYYEKVVDSTLTFAPSAAECVTIALAGESERDKMLEEVGVAFVIPNKRKKKKTKGAVRRLEPLVKDYDSGVLQQAIHSMTLFGWSLYEPGNAPPIDYVEKRNAAQYLIRDQEDLPEREAAWNALLDAYQFTNLDEFDLVLLSGIRDGYFDGKAVGERGAELDKKIRAQKRDNSFAEAWSLYHDSLENNENKVAEAIYSSFIRNVDNISPVNLNGTVQLMKELDRAGQAAEMIRLYVEAHGTDRQVFDLDDYPFHDHITDADIIRAFAEHLSSLKDERDPLETLLSVGSGWNEVDLTLLARLAVDEYYTIFKEAERENLRKMINASLRSEE